MRVLSCVCAVLITGVCAGCGAAESGSVAVIRSDGEIIDEIDLEKYGGDGQFTVSASNGGENVIEIADGCISVVSASCPDKICVQQGERGKNCKNSAPIVCLPNRLSIEIKKGAEEADAVSE